MRMQRRQSPWCGKTTATTGKHQSPSAAVEVVVTRSKSIQSAIHHQVKRIITCLPQSLCDRHQRNRRQGNVSRRKNLDEKPKDKKSRKMEWKQNSWSGKVWDGITFRIACLSMFAYHHHNTWEEDTRKHTLIFAFFSFFFAEKSRTCLQSIRCLQSTTTCATASTGGKKEKIQDVKQGSGRKELLTNRGAEFFFSCDGKFDGSEKGYRKIFMPVKALQTER